VLPRPRYDFLGVETISEQHIFSHAAIFQRKILLAGISRRDKVQLRRNDRSPRENDVVRRQT